MKKLYILLFLSLIYEQTMAQHKCGSDEYYNQQMATDPEFAKNQELLEQATKEYLKNGTLKSASIGAVYTIPVVVHVLHNSLRESKYDSNIDDDQIQSMIDALNNDFGLKNADKDEIYLPEEYKILQANIQIKFELAKRDPNGNCTNGITRDYRDRDLYNDILGDAKSNSKGGVDAWDTKKYLNIWTVPGFTNIEVMGASTFPGETPIQISGIVLNHGVVGIIGTSFDNGHTATHEVGHYLNLKHIWGNSLFGNTCQDSDGVDDTPIQDGPNETCPDPTDSPLISCPSYAPLGDMYMNYMDYTTCRNMFTLGQKNRMHAAMKDPSRNTLVNYNNLALISPQADLSVINQDISSTSVVAGDAITVNFAEYNSGSLNAPPNYVNIHLSSTSEFTPGSIEDKYLDQYFINQAVPGRSETIESSKVITIPLDVTPGDYYLFFAADGTGVVTECDNTNNFASVKITVKAIAALDPPHILKAVAGNEQVTLSWQAPTSGSPSSYRIFMSDTEGGTYSQTGTDTKSTSKILPGLTNGKTYWFYVQAIYASGEKAASTKVSAKPFTLIKLSNDDCSGAKSITSSSSCNYLENQTVNNATASGKLKGSCDNYGTPDLADVWYYFKAQSTSHTITVDPNGSQLDAVIVAYNSCTSSTGINCSDTPGGPGTLSTLNLSGLVIGNSYYIRVYDYGKQTTMGNFRICVSGTSSANNCTITSITPNTKTHGQASFSTTPGADDIYFNAQPNCSFEITNYCSWLTVSPMSGTTNNVGQAFLNYTIEANNSTIVRQCTFYINGSPVTITQNGEDATDDDNDGVINSLDLCPNTTVGELVDANGCSDNQSIIEISNLQYNDVVLNTPQNKTISFSNVGAIDYTITNINLTGTNADQFSIAPIPPIVVSTGTYQNLTVTFNPTSIGAKSAKIEIITNAGQIPTKTITLNGNGVAQLTRVLVCNPATSYNFGDIKKAETASKSFIIQNTGSNTLTISDLAIEGLNPELYSITYARAVPYDIGPGLTELVTVKFSPISVGSKNAILVITNNSDNLSPNCSIGLSGNGIENYYIESINNLNSLEYWFDDDYQAKVNTPATSLFDPELGSQVATEGLVTGLHNIHIRYQDIKGKWSGIVSEFFHKLPVTTVSSPKIIASEYWFDDAFANKVSAAITPNQTITANGGFDVSSLQNGLHSYHVRYKDDAGQWSSVVSEFFQKLPVAAAGSRNIIASEYWFDDDFANKVAAAITPGQTISISSGFEVGSLTSGLHSYHVRYKDDAGQWSSVVSEFFQKLPVSATGSRTITTCEYWFDDAFANKVSTAISPGQTITTNSGFDVSGLSNGLHSYHVRYKDNAGQWSSVVSEFFQKLPLNSEQNNLIVMYRYWFDGNDQALITVNLPDPVTPYQLVRNITTCGLTDGDHTLHFQFKDSYHLWSAVTTDVITKSGTPVAEITANGAKTFCQGNSVTLTSSAADSYLWSNGATTQSIVVTESGNYSVTINKDSGCELTSAATAIVVNPLPKTAGVISGITSVAANQSNVLYSVPAIDNANLYTWTLPTGASGTSTTNSITVSYGNDAVSGSIKVKGHNDCGDGPESSLVVSVGSNATQNIALNTGWNIISANLIPANVNLKDLFQSLIDAGKLKKVMDETGKTLENLGAFGGWRNNIGNLNTAKGYKVNVTATSTLSLEGAPVQLPYDMALNAGWNIISYPSAGIQDAKALVQSLIDAGKLKKVMDEAGKTIENLGAFGGWRNNIGNFIPGKGYKINVTASCTLTIPAGGNKSAVVIPELLASEHFKPVFTGNGTDHMNIHLVNLQNTGIQVGDEIGIFDGTLCVGSATVGAEQLMDGSISIPASCEDGLSAVTDGFSAGHPVRLKHFRNIKEYTLKIEPLLNSQNVFAKGESMFVKVGFDQTTGPDELANETTVKCYPNPFSDQINIEIVLQESQKLEVRIYDVNGKLVRNLYKSKAEKRTHLIWDGKNDSGSKMVPGSYYLKANNRVEKIVLRK